MQAELNMGRAVICVRFALAILTEIVSSFVLWIWLRRHGVNLVFGLTGIPGYLETAYHQWCKTYQHPEAIVLRLRAVSIVNVIASAAFAIPIIVTI